MTSQDRTPAREETPPNAPQNGDSHLSDAERQLSVELGPLREQIDTVDRELLAMLNRRAKLALEVGEVKKKYGAPVFRPERELQVIRKVQGANPGPLLGESVAAIWREVMSACRGLEKPLEVAFLGPAGTFSEQALYAHFGHEVSGVPCPSIDEVFRAVEAGTVEYGVVPVENSTEGAVSRTLDLFLQTSLKISGEIALKVHHNLMASTPDMKGVTVVRAHAQALAQCQHWLTANYPHLERQAVSSNAEAARMASEDPTVAAIAGESAANRYHLHLVRTHIQDDPHNRTRFAVIGRYETEPSGSDQTSLILSVPNKAGAVYQLLAPLAANGVSMCRFESRPARSGAWEYYFYVDVEGHQHEPAVARAIEELRRNAAYLKVLGSYPSSK
ncbi:fused chorismate mutase P; prephenate dehydratase [Cupriavidus taiwanensis]|uniref:Bifunctional chorismate mutase/prephenate dehydratase n=1 Tax=Cupriavidus taiwanensis TaxID=164546 RepID=A0A375DW91_9BURK|nr:prephenate dehydratase [Cupriavidus taiwanensis]SOZ15466.1 fused chorismate mutase P; prephenate dehydratase [Cupriavidus taiwanensis]SOZ27709.1 fused chorismate mutase P; prephenate dehydratase [Cupriavidus taiwanensis]SOZ46037.1 fused chorismate mutase P; prephenate dehydratase [Cupriavidus taiwanensis]SOZ49062.1 fused chorismate mutase P; prephenate dehydratase [Cupriavidus taiwanensis]SOZ49100.1 fused chorismate mutase P; prephenate dehydratase [Cupriavidus taiwanensis]